MLPTGLMLGVWFAGLGLFVLWRAALPSADWRAMIGVAVLGVSGAGVVWGIRQQASGQLRWDGAVWGWAADRIPAHFEPASLTVVADLQRSLIVQLTFQGGRPVWFGVHRADCAQRWLDFRRAAHLPGKPAPMHVSPEGILAQHMTAVARLEIPAGPTKTSIRF